jgi:hypothetical protein
VNLVLAAQLEQLALVGRKEFQGLQALKVKRVKPEPLVRQVPLVLEVSKVKLARPVLLAQQAQLAPPAETARME